MKSLPELGNSAIVRISRQGGFAAISALSRPREIDFAQCDPDQRGQVCSILQSCLPESTAEAGKGDQRFYRIELQVPRQEQPGEMVLQIPEDRAPGELVRLWKDGA